MLRQSPVCNSWCYRATVVSVRAGRYSILWPSAIYLPATVNHRILSIFDSTAVKPGSNQINDVLKGLTLGHSTCQKGLNVHVLVLL